MNCLFCPPPPPPSQQREPLKCHQLDGELPSDPDIFIIGLFLHAVIGRPGRGRRGRRVLDIEYTEWQLPLSGVHSIMMENWPRLVRVRGGCPLPFTVFTITYKVVVYASAERAGYTPPFLLYPYFVLCGSRYCEQEKWPDNGEKKEDSIKFVCRN